MSPTFYGKRASIIIDWLENHFSCRKSGHLLNIHMHAYTVISPMGDEVKQLLKDGSGRIFECFHFSLESRPTHCRCKRCSAVVVCVHKVELLTNL